jgi:hypothetical protein
MAEAGSWPSIRQYGLRSTEALLDLFEIGGAERERILSSRRPAKVVIEHRDYGRAVIRDNLPILDSQLASCLYGDVSVSEWYRILNRKVFFWVSEARLVRLLGARAYRNEKHDVLTVDTASLLGSHAANVVLSPINSGATRPAPQPRGRDTFLALTDYPFASWRSKRGARAEVVVECAIDYAVLDIERHTLSVDRQQAGHRSVVVWRPA